jgi:hypothetical protein
VHTIAVEFDAKFGAALDIHAATIPIFVIISGPALPFRAFC